MAQIEICDGCSGDLANKDRLHLTGAIITVGMVQGDLCPTCAAPFWELPVGQTLLAQAVGAKEVEEARRLIIMQNAPPPPGEMSPSPRPEVKP
jgi:hypothetical protein